MSFTPAFFRKSTGTLFFSTFSLPPLVFFMPLPLMNTVSRRSTKQAYFPSIRTFWPSYFCVACKFVSTGCLPLFNGFCFFFSPLPLQRIAHIPSLLYPSPSFPSHTLFGYFFPDSLLISPFSFFADRYTPSHLSCFYFFPSSETGPFFVFACLSPKHEIASCGIRVTSDSSAE